jgi:phosphonate transport system substrate-binding protein
LRGKKLLVQDSAGTASNSFLWLDTLLLRQKLPIVARFFHTVKRVDKSSQAVLPVFFRQTDACLVPRWAFDTMVELNPQVGNDLKIFIVSPMLARGAFFMRKNLPPQKRVLVDVALKLQNSTRIRQFMTLFHSENLVAYQPSYLEPTLALYEEFTALSKRR